MPRARLWWASAAGKGRGAACFDRGPHTGARTTADGMTLETLRPWEFPLLCVRPSSGNGTKLGNRPGPALFTPEGRAAGC